MSNPQSPIKKLVVAALQMRSTPDRSHNLATATGLIEEAVKLGAEIITLPEYFSVLAETRDFLAAAEDIDGPSLKLTQKLARQHAVTILAGTIPIRDGAKAWNASFMMSPTGDIAARYNKIHLFRILYLFNFQNYSKL